MGKLKKPKVKVCGVLVHRTAALALEIEGLKTARRAIDTRIRELEQDYRFAVIEALARKGVTTEGLTSSGEPNGVPELVHPDQTWRYCITNIWACLHSPSGHCIYDTLVDVHKEHCLICNKPLIRDTDKE